MVPSVKTQVNAPPPIFAPAPPGTAILSPGGFSPLERYGVKRVLVVDDEESIRMLIEAALEGPDFSVCHADNGRDALGLVRTAPPDVVVLDWVMPGMQGTDVLRELRAQPATRDIPVVVVTAMCQERNREEAVAAGAAAYLSNPVSPRELLRTINSDFQERELRASDLPAHTAAAK